MNTHEIALQLTLKAMETGLIVADHTTDNTTEAKNEFNRRQVKEFYVSMVDAIDKTNAEECLIQA